ncbi:hypothetical protein [Geoalkalibacter subterraneus]|nr:hypothetical protein [Geoalkalibacter subterraneus]
MSRKAAKAKRESGRGILDFGLKGGWKLVFRNDFWLVIGELPDEKA